MGTCERREIQCRIHGKCKQWSSCWSWNFPAAGKQTKLNLIGRIRHVTHFRANSVHLDVLICPKERVNVHSDMLQRKVTVPFKILLESKILINKNLEKKLRWEGFCLSGPKSTILV